MNPYDAVRRDLAALLEALGEKPRRRPRGSPVRERLAAMLTEAGYPPKGLPASVQGWYRINRSKDDTTVCWDTFVTRGVRTLHVVSYDTMTACVRNGFDVSEDDSLVWVTARTRDGKPR